jgi:predicted O-linked N-acetylglucosamine transferase (SPINDLY family)
MARPPPAAPQLAAMIAQAVQYHRAGDLARAEPLYAQIQAISRNHPLATLNHAMLLARTGRERAAVAKLQGLVKAHPDDALAHRALGQLLWADSGPSAPALYHLRRAVTLDPAQLDAHLELINGYGTLGRMADARQAAEAAMAGFPGRPEPQTQLGVAAIAAGEREEGRRLLEAAVERYPRYAPALYNLARLLDDLGQMEAALALYRRARVADPGFEPAAFNAGDLELRAGDVAAAIACFDASLAQHPADPAALTARLMAAQYVPGVTAESLAVLHALFEQRVGAKLRPAVEPRTDPDPGRRLRVGLVSADLHEHPVGYFLIRAVEARDPAAVEYIVYAGGAKDDALGRRFRKAIPQWHDIAAWSDARLAEQIRRDRIDVLIDLAGHTRDSRLAAFARHPAPIQLTWAGYVGTTGLAAMDGLIADRFHVPPEHEPHYVERIVRLPDGYVSFDPPAAAPEVTPLPAGMDGPLTFASFHKPTKINPPLVQVWARLLAAEPGARILFAYAGYELAEVQARIAGWFAAEGIGAERLVFEGRLPQAKLLARYGRTDIALDSFPYSGGLTTLEALWMGVPVVTLPGRSFAGRHSFSHLSVVGLTETIAADADDYVAVVRRLGADRARLAALRAGLRGRVANSPLCDGPRFARGLEAALRGLWRERCVSWLSLPADPAAPASAPARADVRR